MIKSAVIGTIFTFSLTSLPSFITGTTASETSLPRFISMPGVSAQPERKTTSHNTKTAAMASDFPSNEPTVDDALISYPLPADLLIGVLVDEAGHDGS